MRGNEENDQQYKMRRAFREQGFELKNLQQGARNPYSRTIYVHPSTHLHLWTPSWPSSLHMSPLSDSVQGSFQVPLFPGHSHLG